MKKFFSLKKIFLCSLSVLLSVVVLFSALPGEIFINEAVGETPSTQTGYKDLHEYQRVRWNYISKEVFGNTVNQIAEDYDFSVTGNLNDDHAPRADEIRNNKVKVQPGNKFFNWADSEKTGADSSLPQRNLALYNDYDVTQYNEAYMEDITDGVILDTFDATQWPPKWYGIANGREADKTGTIVVDLGTESDISKVKVHLSGTQESAGIGTPSAVKVSTSNDGSTYGDVVNFEIPAEAPTNPFWIESGEVNQSARYIKLQIESQAPWTFLDEVEIMGTGVDVWNGKLFGYLDQDPAAQAFLNKAMNNRETVVYETQSVEGGDGVTYYMGRQEINYIVFDVTTVEQLQFAMRYANTTGEHIKINILNDLDMNGQEHYWQSIIYDQYNLDLIIGAENTTKEERYFFYEDSAGQWYLNSSNNFVWAQNPPSGATRYKRAVDVNDPYSISSFSYANDQSIRQFDDKYGSRVYIEGNGHTIYNMKTTGDDIRDGYTATKSGDTYTKVEKINEENRSAKAAGTTGFIGRCTTKALTMKNLDFENSLVFSRSSGAAVAVSLVGNRCYLENINVKDSFVFGTYAYAATVLGWNYSSNGSVFVRNCSSEDCIVYGSFHSGGLTACQHNHGTNYLTKYDVAFPENPDAWITDVGRYYMNGDNPVYLTTDLTRSITSSSSYGVNESRLQHLRRLTVNIEKNVAVYPQIIENCYSTNCEIFSIDPTGDSGAFISCAGKLAVRNCFTNNIIYGNIRTGAFIGRIVTQQSYDKGMYDDKGDTTVEAYFENCFSSGSVEGVDEIGGFTGYEDGINIESAPRGVTVYKNCYTTAMVGMDYSGNYLGGFIGHEQTYKSQRASIAIGKDSDGKNIYNTNTGSIYINCYAAGEVGNILTDTATKPSDDSFTQGGFLGGSTLVDRGVSYKASDIANTGNFINCYYDKQTTAMHERAVGIYNQFKTRFDSANNSDSDYSWTNGEYYSQIPGVTGLYTQTSESKKVQGLADTDKLMDGEDSAGVWSYGVDSYPQFTTFYNDQQRADIIQAPVYGTDASNATKKRIDKRLLEKDITVQQYSLASVSTVLLSHWDTIMNVDTGEVNDENNWKAGLDQNKMKKNADGYWEIKYENLAAQTYKFAIQEGHSRSYEFGYNQFKGDPIELTVEEEGMDVVIRFRYDKKVSELGGDTPFVVYGDFYNSNGEFVETKVLSKKDSAAALSTWNLTGNFEGQENWDPTDTEYDMVHVGSDVFEITRSLKAGEYAFKITRDHSWAENYGVAGTYGGDNMYIILSQDAQVTFQFNANTKETDVYASIPEALADYTKEKKPTKFNGYTLIAPEPVTGHNWNDGDGAINDGLMSTTDGGKTYTKEFTINAYDGNQLQLDKLYGYKVIEYGSDGNDIQTFFIDVPDGDADNFTGTVKVRFTYRPNPAEGEKQYDVRVVDVRNSNGTQLAVAVKIDDGAYTENFSVLGTSSLTKLPFDWADGDNKDTAKANGEMGKGEDGLYVKTYKAVPAGTHEFKIAADGSFDSGLVYGSNDGSGANYTIKLNKESNVTISFDPVNEYISVIASGDDALVIDKYVVSCTKSLSGGDTSWTIDDYVMDYIDTEGKYTYTFTNIPVGTNFSFKVLPFNVRDDSKGIHSFRIDGSSDEVYSLAIDYYDKTGVTTWFLYNEDGDNVTANQLKEPMFESYSVFGNKELTGYHWGKENESDPDNALVPEAGVMTSIADGVYEITFENVPVSQVSQIYEFKVVPEGSWDSGISYGNVMGGNYRLPLANPTETSCAVTITFNEHTKEITVTSNPECMDTIDESSFQWYIIGDYQLASNLDRQVSDKVYDTVRDITATFFFTGKYSYYDTDSMLIDWSVDREKNEEGRLKNYIGGMTAEESKGFDLDYTVDGYNINGDFDQPVLTIDYDEGTGYYCREFVPGKNWIEVACSEVTDEHSIVGTRNLRILPTAYLESGNDATVNVLQAGNDTEGVDAKNSVNFNKNRNDGINFTNSKDNTTFSEIASDTTKRIYFINTYNWEQVYAHHWNDSQDSTKFPGEAMTKVLGTTDVYYVDVPMNRRYIAFNDGSSDNKTRDLDAPAGSNYEYMAGRGWKSHVDPATYQGKYYLDGFINGKDNNGMIFPEYTFRENTLVVTFARDSYINVRSFDNFNIEYGAVTYPGDDATSVNMLEGYSERLKIPAGDWKITVKENGDGSLAISYTEADAITFDYYNIALTAGYGITDQVGLGYYGNYADQEVVKYSSSNAGVRPLKIAGKENCETFYMMTSVFSQKASYDDSATDNGIKLDEFAVQALIGNSNSSNEKRKAKTIIKVYKKEVEAGEIKWPKVVFNSKSTGTTEHYNNYLKWSGQKAFTDGDVGEYMVVYYWSLSDGRYLEDAKYVTVRSYDTDVIKAVDKRYIEKDYPSNGQDKTARDVTYTLTYTNRIKGSFTIDDILPYNGDFRDEDGQTNNTGDQSTTISSQIDNGTAFTFKNFSWEVSGTNLKVDSSTYTTEVLKTNSTGQGSQTNLNNVGWTNIPDWEKISFYSFNKDIENYSDSTANRKTSDVAISSSQDYIIESDCSVTNGKFNMLYLIPEGQWKQNNERYSVFFFNDSSSTWRSMKDANGDGVYSVQIPDGDWTGYIYCRMNGETTENNWDNKWDQSIDMAFPDENNCYRASGSGTITPYEGTYYSEHLLDAENLKVNSDDKIVARYSYGSTSEWVELPGTGNIYNVLTPDVKIKSVKGIRLNGRNTTGAEATITVKYTLTVDFDTDMEKFDRYINNVFYTVTENKTDQSINGYSNPVLTAIVARSVDGYSWYDKNLNGVFDKTESSVSGVGVKLYKLGDNGNYYYDSRFGVQVTNKDGYYVFPAIYEGSDVKNDFRVVFTSPEEISKAMMIDSDNKPSVFLKPRAEWIDKGYAIKGVFTGESTTQTVDFKISDEGVIYEGDIPDGSFNKVQFVATDSSGSTVAQEEAVSFSNTLNYFSFAIASNNDANSTKVTLHSNALTETDAETRLFSELKITRRMSDYHTTEKYASRNVSRKLSDEDAVKFGYPYYVNQSLPSGDKIVQHNNDTGEEVRYNNGVIVNYKFSKNYQNLGLAPIDPDEKSKSLTITKVNELGEVMQGVVFEIQWREDDTKKYKALTCNYDSETDTYNYSTDENSKIYEKFSTNEMGLIKIAGLETGEYKIKEVATAEGYNLLDDEIKVILPMILDDVKVPNGVAISKNDEADYNGNNAYYDIAFTVTNMPYGFMPVTGATSNNLMLIIGMAIMLLGVILVVVYKIKTRKNYKHLR